MTPIDTEENNQDKTARSTKRSKDNTEDVLESYTSIISMSTTESFYDVFSQNGILINHVDFKDIVEKYGDPCAVSPDGTKFLFKKHESTISNSSKNKSTVTQNNEKELINALMTVSILKLSIFGLTHIKDVCIMKELKNCLREERDPSQPPFI